MHKTIIKHSVQVGGLVAPNFFVSQNDYMD